jgi:hypothetical protein
MKPFLFALMAMTVTNGCRYDIKTYQTSPVPDEPDFEQGVDMDIPWHSPTEIAQIKTELGINLPTENPLSKSLKSDRKELVMNVKSMLTDRLETAKKVDKATKNIVKLAVLILRRKGFTDKADEIEQEYKVYNNFTYMYAIGAFNDIGDHPPMWEWLDRLEKDLRERLGDFIMKATRLEDLRTFNYGLPIVLQPAGDERTNPATVISLDDYAQHFIPFSGCLSYWTAWGICTGATWGIGAIVFICSPIGMITERIVVTKIAPDLANNIWNEAN